MHTHEPWLACWGQRTTCQQKWSLFSSSVTWVLGIEFRPSGLVASTSVCWTISLACEKLLLSNMISCVLWFEYEIPLVGSYVRLFPSLGYCYFGRFFKLQDIRSSRGRELLEMGLWLVALSLVPSWLSAPACQKVGNISTFATPIPLWCLCPSAWGHMTTSKVNSDPSPPVGYSSSFTEGVGGRQWLPVLYNGCTRP